MLKHLLLTFALIVFPWATWAHSQSDHSQHKHPPASKPKQAPPKKPAEKSAAPAAQPQQTGHEQHKHESPQPAAHDDHAQHNTMKTPTGGPFQSMHAIGSGTSLLPASSPGYMWHWMRDGWMIMLHGDLKAGWNHQGGPRGVNKAESQNWLMGMAEKRVGPGYLMFRGMFSAEPATTPRGGFPELFQTGETLRGRPIVDAQHPHELFMELAAEYTVPISEKISMHFYGGPVGEPALGPTAFMHRPSAIENPAAPLGHHLQDSTHIAHGVVTAGVTAGRFRFEGSAFRGAEPDEDRLDIELGKIDSWSGRAWWVPTEDWAVQVSRGHLNEPEASEPGDIDRTTASVSHNRRWDDGAVASTFVWGRNREEHGVFNSYLLESTLNVRDKNSVYSRLELVDKSGLLEQNVFGRGLGSGLSGEQPHHDRNFRVGAVTFGAVRDIVARARVRIGVGADVTFYHVPPGLESTYGSSPRSFHVFLRIRPGRHSSNK